ALQWRKCPQVRKIELVRRRKERISSPPPQISWSQKVEKNFVLSGEVNVNQRQDGNGATGTTRSSLSQVPRGCNGTVKVSATFVYLSVTSGTPDFRCSNGVTICDLFEPTDADPLAVVVIIGLISCGYSDCL